MVSEENQRESKLTYDSAVKQITHAEKNGYKNIDFYGGDPTIFSFLKKTIRLSNDLGMDATLATNSVKFSSKQYADDFFSGIRIEGIRTSLHSNRATIHDRITGIQGSFDKTIKGIRNILRYNRRFSVNIVITSLNHKELSEIVNFIYKLGVRGVKFSGLIFEERALNNQWLAVNLALLSFYLRKAISLSLELGFYYIECEKLPICVLKNRQLKFVHYILESNSKFIKAQVCYSCKFKEKCNGLDPLSLNQQNLHYLRKNLKKI